MQVDSGTESESGEESSFALPSQDPSIPPLSLQETAAGLDRIESAIKIIRDACIAELLTNVETQAKVMGAVKKVALSLDSILDLRSGWEESISGFKPLVEPKFLSILFNHRKIFRSVTIQQSLPVIRNTSVMVCWPDVLLAKLSEVTSLLAGGPVKATTSVSAFFTRQREQDTLMAATQLPDTWSSVACVLEGPHSSPAARRLALRLLFAAFMIGPWLSGKDPWSDPENISSLDLLNVLDRYISKSSSSTLTYGPELDYARERLTFSMTLCLYAAADTEDRYCRNHLPLRPRTLGILLTYLHYIVSLPDVPSNGNTMQFASSFEALDPPQSLLFKWRETVLWCWQTWNDNRIANSENVVYLTTRWLFHYEIDDTEKTLTGIGDINFERMLRNDPKACSEAIVRVLHQLIGLLLASPGLTNQDPRFSLLISKAITPLLRLFRENFTDHGFQRSDNTQEVFRCLMSLFILSPEKGGECSAAKIKWGLLEVLTLLDTAIAKHVLLLLCKDKKLAFTEKIDDLMFRTRRYLTGEYPKEFQSDEIARVNLDFVAFVWYNTGKDVLHGQALVPFLSGLGEYLKREAGGFVFNSATSCFSVLDNHPSCDIENCKTSNLWKACIQAPCSDLAIAASFAYSVLHLDSFTRVDDVLCVQAFDYLRGSLVLAIRGEYIDKDEPVALSVSSLLCSAMIRLLNAAVPAVTCMVLSPWTKTFCVNLKALLHSNCPNASYQGILKRRLDLVGNRLLDLIEGNVDNDISEPSPLQCRLIMCEQFDLPSLIFIPDE